MNERTVVIGLGNPLMADDGAGLEALARLGTYRFAPDLELVDGGTWGMNLLPTIEAADRVLFLDAINVGVEPGTVVTLERDQLPRFLRTRVSPHQVDLHDVLALAELRGTLPAVSVAIGVQPANVEMRLGLAPVVEQAVRRVIAAALRRLREWGYRAAREAGISSELAPVAATWPHRPAWPGHRPLRRSSIRPGAPRPKE